jgi:hypothetical protein
MLSSADEQVCCRYQASQPSRWHTMTLPAQEFIRRFLPHMWPQGFHTVRYYGLWSPVHRPLLHQLQLWLAAQHPPAPLASPDQESQSSGSTSCPLQAGRLCPHCGQGVLVVIRQLPRQQRGPPCATALPCGLPKPASAGPQVPETVASSHPSTSLPATMAGHRLPPPLAALDPARRPRPHPSAPFAGSQGATSASHECASQAAQAGLKFHTRWCSGSVHHRCCVGSAPQKLFFVRLRQSRSVGR